MLQTPVARNLVWVKDSLLLPAGPGLNCISQERWLVLFLLGNQASPVLITAVAGRVRNWMPGRRFLLTFQRCWHSLCDIQMRWRACSKLVTRRQSVTSLFFLQIIKSLAFESAFDWLHKFLCYHSYVSPEHTAVPLWMVVQRGLWLFSSPKDRFSQRCDTFVALWPLKLNSQNVRVKNIFKKGSFSFVLFRVFFFFFSFFFFCLLKWEWHKLFSFMG